MYIYIYKYVQMVISKYLKDDQHIYIYIWVMGGCWYRIVIPLTVQDDGSPRSVLMSHSHLD